MNQRILIHILSIAFMFFSMCSVQAAENKILSIDWDNNSLTVNTVKKIMYTEARLKDPERLIIDILNCDLNNETNINNLSTRLGETISISESSGGNIRIIFIGDASINRKAYLTGDEKTLVIRIARVDSTKEEELIVENNEQTPIEKDEIGQIKDISVEEGNNETRINISTTKSVKYNTYKLKNPDRLAVDLLNILPPNDSLPYLEKTTHISGLRIGSAASGIEATRIVIDLTDQNIESEVSSNILGNKLRIKLKPITDKSKAIPRSTFKVVIDPGHGGYDTGASYGGFNEKDINLSVSEKLKKYLEPSGITVFLTREDDSFISLAERNDITNTINPDVFISIHANALKTSAKIRGLETYYWTGQSQKLAYTVHKRILNTVNLPDHFLRKARFYVIRYTSVPAILVEMGFMTNGEDRKLVTSSTTQDKYAKAIGDSILNFLDILPAGETAKKVEGQKANDKQ